MKSTEFIKQKLAQYDLRRLAGVYYRPYSQYQAGLCDGDSIPGKVAIFIYDWPDFPVTIPITGRWLNERAYSKAEYDVFIAGHEAYHFLCATNQIRSSNTELRADAMGRRWLWEYRASRLLGFLRSALP